MSKSAPQHVQTRYVATLLDILASDYGVSEEALAPSRALCLDRDDLPEGFISLADFAEVTANALALCNDPWLGLHMGQRLPTGHLGAVAAAASSSDRVRDALTLMDSFSSTLLPIPAELNTGPARARFSFSLPESMALQREFFAQILISTMLKFLEESTGYLPRDLAVQLPFPDNPGYAERLPHQLSFNQEALAFSFPVSYLDAPLLTSDPTTRALILEACNNLARRLTESRTLGSSITQLLDNCSGQYPTLENVADILHVTPRTLRNRLAKENLSYREMLKLHRIKRAKRLLASGDLPVAEIADRLGYDTPANFCRAFKREVSMTPSSFRVSASPQPASSALQRGTEYQPPK
ncbi:MAG: helix-turn-helix domain-containing protein [Pseudomonadota bacterium]